MQAFLLVSCILFVIREKGKTNIPEIDEIRQRRLNNARAQIGSFADQMSMESLPYVNNYIQDINSKYVFST